MFTVLFLLDHLCRTSKRTDKKNSWTANDYSKVAEQKSNMQMLIIFLYTIREQVEFEIESRVPFTLVPPPNEILRYKPSKIMCMICMWKTKKLMCKIKDLNKG